MVYKYFLPFYKLPFHFLLFPFFFGSACGVQKIPNQGLNPSQSSDLSPSSDNAKSLTMRPLRKQLPILLVDSCDIPGRTNFPYLTPHPTVDHQIKLLQVLGDRSRSQTQNLVIAAGWILPGWQENKIELRNLQKLAMNTFCDRKGGSWKYLRFISARKMLD